jgi:hypothetical protein
MGSKWRESPRVLHPAMDASRGPSTSGDTSAITRNEVVYLPNDTAERRVPSSRDISRKITTLSPALALARKRGKRAIGIEKSRALARLRGSARSARISNRFLVSR